MLSFLIFSLIFSAPDPFPTDKNIVIKRGTGSVGIASLLKEEGMIRSSNAFLFLLRLTGKQGELTAGEYVFKKPESLFSVMGRITTGDYGLSRIKVTFPEGTSVKQMSAILAESLPNFDAGAFVALAAVDEGFLFPETYIFFENAEPAQVIQRAKDTFNEKIVPLQTDIKKFGKTLRDVVIMASIVEEEARTMESRRMIAGILWKRISINMPLQVDAAFQYVNGKRKSEDLTARDLKDATSPYNTYVFRGLPPGPITNPGLVTIRATITPIKSDYLYYISDKKGEMHYAKTFDEHKLNIAKYLR